MSRWYRAYEGTVTDAKLGEVALVAGCSRSVAIAAWHCILESCASVNDGGRFDATLRRVAVILLEPVATIQAVFAEMESLGMIKGDHVGAWTRRQFESDSSTERSRKRRETLRNKIEPSQSENATPVQRCATPPYTETDTETEKKEKEQAALVPKRPRAENPVGELSEAIGPELAKAIVEHRQRLRKPLTVFAARLLAKQFLAAPDPRRAAETMIERGWQSFRADWDAAERQRGPPNSPIKTNARLQALMDTAEHAQRNPGRNPNPENAALFDRNDPLEGRVGVF